MVRWTRANKLKLNVKKCNVISFHRNRAPIIADYSIDSEPLQRLPIVRDLGVRLDTKMTFIDHIDGLIAKAMSMLGFIKRICGNMDDPYTKKSIYCSLVRSILEYNGVVWSPAFAIHSKRIESIQRNFTRFALRTLPWRDPNTLPPYKERCLLINIESLEMRRQNAAALFVFDLLSNRIDSPQLLSRLNFNVPQRSTRHATILIPVYHHSDSGLPPYIVWGERAGKQDGYHLQYVSCQL